MAGRGCGVCGGQTPEAAAQRLQQIIDDHKAELITPYKGAFSEITIKCAEEHTFTTTASNVKRGGWCNMCKRRGNEYTGVEINDIITSRHGVLISRYVDRRTKITLYQCGRTLYLQVAGVQFVRRQILSQPRKAFLRRLTRWVVRCSENMLMPILMSKSYVTTDIHFICNHRL